MATVKRLGTAELLFQCAQQMGLEPTWLTPGGLFAISTPEEEKYIHFAHSPLNSHTSASLTRNKYMTRIVLERNGLPNIPFCRPRSQLQAEVFLYHYKKIIAKPLGGSGSRDIHIVTLDSQLQELSITKYILEQYIAGQEMRYLVLDGRVIGVHRSEYGVSVEKTRALQRISYPENTWDPKLVAWSVEIANVLGLKFAAVDYLVDDSDQAHILEVNSAPGLKWFHAPTSGPAIDVARLFLETMLQEQSAKALRDNNTSLGIQPIPAYN